MAAYPYSFTVVTYHSYDAEKQVGKYRRDSGMGIATSFADAAKQIESYYDNDLVSIQKLELHEEGHLIFLPEGCIEEYKRAEWDGSSTQIPCDHNGVPVIEEEEVTNEC